MTRDCTTTRINRIHLLDLVDATRQMVTIRMPALRVQDLNAVPEGLDLAEGTPSTPIVATNVNVVEVIDVIEAIDPGDEITRPIEIPVHPKPAAIFRTPDVHGGGDVTLIGVICAVSMTACGALAWFG